jgi:serine protease
VTELEPNNSLAAAQVLSVGARLAGTLASSTDTDYYRFSIAPGRSVVVKLTPNASSDYDLYAYNSAGTRIASSVLGTGAVDTITLSNSSTTASASAIAYVRVIYFGGSTGATGTYQLTLQ